MFRAEGKVWQKLSASIQSGANRYAGKNPQQCGFFAGDEFKSHFVSTEKASELKGAKNGRWKYLADEEAIQHITSHLIKYKNILNELRKRTHEITLQTSRKNSEKRYYKTCR